MNPNVPIVTLDFPGHLAKRQRHNEPRSVPEEANLMGKHTPTPSRELSIIQNRREIIFPILVPKPVPEPPQLSRLQAYLPARDDYYSMRMRESFSLEVKSVKKTLISSLASGNADNTNVDNTNVDFMINLANAAFNSLSSFHAKFGHLYELVRLFISYHCRLSEAKNKLKKNGSIPDMLARKANLAVRSREAASALRGSKVALAHASSNVAVLMAKAEETRKFLNQIEASLARASSEVVVLRAKSDRLENAYTVAKSDYLSFTRRAEDKMMIEREINSNYNRTVAEIEKIRATLSTYYWLD